MVQLLTPPPNPHPPSKSQLPQNQDLNIIHALTNNRVFV